MSRWLSCLVHAAAMLLLLPAVHHAQKSDEALSADLKAFQGVWRGWVVEGKGEQADRGPVQLQIVVVKDTIVAKRLGRTKDDDPLGEGTFQLALAEKQKTIDATRTSAPAKGKIHLGIYSLEGDTFRWCVGNQGKERPTDFVTRRGQFLLILKRATKK